MQYLAWIKDASKHVLASNLFVLRDTPADYFNPAVVVSGGLTALGMAPWLSLLLWKPVAVIGFFFAVRGFAWRLLSRRVAAPRGARARPVLRLVHQRVRAVQRPRRPVPRLPDLGLRVQRDGARRDGGGAGRAPRLPAERTPDMAGGTTRRAGQPAPPVERRAADRSGARRRGRDGARPPVRPRPPQADDRHGRSARGSRSCTTRSSARPTSAGSSPRSRASTRSRSGRSRSRSFLCLFPRPSRTRGARRRSWPRPTRTWPLAAFAIFVLSGTSLGATPLHSFQGITIPLAVLAVEGFQIIGWQPHPAPGARRRGPRRAVHDPDHVRGAEDRARVWRRRRRTTRTSSRAMSATPSITWRTSSSRGA